MERQIFTALLAIAAGSADSAFLVVNRFALSCKSSLPPSKSASANKWGYLSRHIQVSCHCRTSTAQDHMRLTLLRQIPLSINDHFNTESHLFPRNTFGRTPDGSSALLPDPQRVRRLARR